MTLLSTNGRPLRSYPAPAWARRAGTDGASATATPQRAREAIRQYGYGMGWHTRGVWGSFLGGLCGESWEMRRKYPEMFFREGSIKSPLLSQVWSVASLDLQVLPADKTSEQDRAAADAYRDALLDVEGGFPQIAAEILLPARIRGESLCHMSLRERLEDRGKWRGKRMLHAVKAKPPGSYQLRFDDFGNLVEIKATSGGDSYVGGQLNEFIHYKWLSLEGSDGVSDLRAAVGAFEAKDAVWKLRMFFADKLAGGYVCVSGVTEKDRAAVMAALAEGRSCGFFTLPPGMEPKVLDLVLGASAEYKSFIEDCDREMMIAIGGSHLPYSEGQGSDNRGNTKVQRQVSSETEWAMASQLSFILSRKAKVFVDENFAGAGYPKAQLSGGIDPAVAKAQLDNLVTANTIVPVSAGQVYEVSGAQPPSPEDPRDVVPVHPLHPVAGAAPPGAPAAPAGAAPFADGAAQGDWVWEEDLAGTEASSHG
jgi:hypothetical protein